MNEEFLGCIFKIKFLTKQSNFITYIHPEQDDLENYVGRVEYSDQYYFLPFLERIIHFNSPFPSVFYLFEELSAIYVQFKIVVCKLFQFGRV